MRQQQIKNYACDAGLFNPLMMISNLRIKAEEEKPPPPPPPPPPDRRDFPRPDIKGIPDKDRIPPPPPPVRK